MGQTYESQRDDPTKPPPPPPNLQCKVTAFMSGDLVVREKGNINKISMIVCFPLIYAEKAIGHIARGEDGDGGDE